MTYYGHQAGVDDADVSAAINAGLGLIAYRGHGSSSAWTNWNTYGEYFNSTDVAALTNTQHPVVWAFACTNSKITNDQCIAEFWMEQDDYGAVSYYGSSDVSYTSQNHELDRQMFKAVYNEGLKIQGQAIEYGEENYVRIHGGKSNAWMYLLLGDPSMRIKTHGGMTLAADMPEVATPGFFNLDLYFFDAENNMPLADAVFAVWKPIPGREEGDEVFDNQYTDSNGHVTLSIEPQSEGMLYWTLRGPGGETVLDSIPIVEGTDAPSWTSGKRRFWADPSVTDGASTLRFSSSMTIHARVNIYDVSGRMLRELDLLAGHDETVWDGRDTQGKPVPGGVYFARVKAGELEKVARITVIR
jgi:hypothetical protein